MTIGAEVAAIPSGLAGVAVGIGASTAHAESSPLRIAHEWREAG